MNEAFSGRALMVYLNMQSRDQRRGVLQLASIHSALSEKSLAPDFGLHTKHSPGKEKFGKNAETDDSKGDKCRCLLCLLSNPPSSSYK